MPMKAELPQRAAMAPADGGTGGGRDYSSALEEMQGRLQMALDAAAMGTFIWYVEEDRTEADPRLLEIFGLPPDGELSFDAALMTSIHPEDRQRYADAIGRATDPSGDFRLREEIRVFQLDRSVRWLAITARVHLDAGGKPHRMTGVAMDITDTRHREEALRESEGRLRVALEAGRMGTWRFNLKTGEQQWSTTQFEIFGLKPAQSPPDRGLFLSIVHPDDLHLVEFGTEDIRPEGTHLDSEFRIVRPDGQLRWVAAHALATFGEDGKPVEIIGVNQDVTDRRRFEEALRHSEERLRELGEASSDILWIADAKTLQWEYLSPAFDKICGISRQDALRGDHLQQWLSLVLPEDRDTVLNGLALARQGSRLPFEFRVRRPVNGEARWLRNTAFPMPDETGEVVRIGGIMQDFTAGRASDEHQRFLLSELQHRVRNTLAVIRSIARHTARNSATVEDFRTHLEGRIDAFARVQAALMRTPATGVDLESMIADELRAYQGSGAEAPVIEGTSVRLRAKPAESFALAVHELATNAVKYGALSAPTGRLRVAWSIGTSGTEKLFEFRWAESGLEGLPPSPRRRGFGTEVLERSLAYELGADTRLSFRPDGLDCRISVPVERLLMP